MAVSRKRMPPAVFRLPDLVTVGEVQGWEDGDTARAGAFDHAGKTLVIADRHDNLIFYDVAKGLTPFDSRTFDWLSGVENLHAQPGGDLWLFNRRDRVLVWDARKRSEVARWQTQGHPHWLRWTSDGSSIVYGARGTVRVVDPRTGHDRLKYSPTDLRTARGDGPLLLMHGTYNRGSEVWDSERGVKVSTLAERPLHAAGVGFLADSRRLAVGTHDGEVEIWALFTGARDLRRYKVGKRPVTATVGSPDGRFLVAGDDKGHIKVFRLSDGGVERSFKVSPGPVRQLTFSPTGELLVTHWDSGVTYRLDTGLKRAALTVAADGRLAWFDDGNVFLPGPKGGNRERRRIHAFGNQHIYQMQFSADGAHLLARTTDGSVHRLDGKTGESVSRIDPGEVPVETFAQSPDGQLLAAVDEQAVVRLYVGRETTPRVSLFIDNAGEWIVWRSDGAFDASPGGGRYVGWRVGTTVHSVDAFSEQFRVPGLLGRSLRKGEPAVKVAGFSGKFSAPPKVILHGPKAGDTEAERVQVRVEAIDAGGGVSEIRLYHQGRLVGRAGTRGINLGGGGGGPGKVFDVLLEAGENRLVASAFSKGRSEGRSAPLILKRTGKSVDVGLRVLAIGIDAYRDSSLRLRHARSDATAIVEALRTGGKALFRRGIEHKLLTDAAATKKGILAGLKWLEKTSEPEDVALVFIAAHGETVDGQYYLLPQDVRFTGLDSLVEQGISQESLMDAIHRIRARKVVVLLDTCKSGAVAQGFGTRGLAEKRAPAVLAKASGVYLIAASTAQQAAVEDSDLGHGVFTWSLMEGLKGGADLDGDRAVSIRELVTYVESEVARISREKFNREQFPVTHGTGRNFPLVMRR